MAGFEVIPEVVVWLLSLKRLTRCGFNPCARQMRPTEDGLTPATGASVRVLQWVAPAGVSRVVFATISAILESGMTGGRPERGAVFSPWIPFS